MENLGRGGHGRVALVTGAGTRDGLGFETAKQLAQIGFRVLLSSRYGSVAAERAAELRERGHDAVGTQLDGSDSESVRALAQRLGQEDQVNVLVNIPDRVPIIGENVTCADLLLAYETMNAVVFETWRVSQCVLPFLLGSPHPRIVNVSSGVGLHDGEELPAPAVQGSDAGYAVARAALHELTTRFARDVRPLGVLVNAVSTHHARGTEPTEPASSTADRALGVVWAATLPDDGPSGGLFRDGVPVPW